MVLALGKAFFSCRLRGTLFFIAAALFLILTTPGIGTAGEISPWDIHYEIALYRYMTNDFVDASADFNRLLHTADKNQVKSALHFSILSLAAMNQKKEVLQKLKIYRKTTQPETLFGAAEKFYEWGDYEAADEILKISQRKLLASRQADRQNFLMGRVLVHLEEGKKRPLEYLNKVTRKSEYYAPAQSLKVRLLFRDREFESAISSLEALLLKIEKKMVGEGEYGADAINLKLLLGKMYFENKNPDKALAIFKELKDTDLAYSASVGLYRVYFKTGRFMDAAGTLKLLKRDYSERFNRDGLPLDLAFSVYYAKEYREAELLFKELTRWMELRRRAMEKILAEDIENPVIAISVVKGFFGNNGNPPPAPAGEPRSFKANRELEASHESRLVLHGLAESGGDVAKKSSQLQMTYKMEFGPLDSFVQNFDKRVKRLDNLYKVLKKEVEVLNFRVGGTVHNKNYFKEWFESNLSQFSQGKMHKLTDFEKKIVQMFTHEIMYRQKIDTEFITKIVANKKSLENLHAMASSTWPERVKKIISDYNLGLKELDQIENILSRLKEMNGEIKNLGKALVTNSVASIRKEAFRILVGQEIIAEDVKMASAKTREALAQPVGSGNNVISR